MIGQTISHYRILEKIGEGGMGVVYKAEDTRLHRAVALKFLPARVTEDGAIRARFFQEARTASVLDHPNIATIYEIDEAAGEWFIAMAYVEGETLKERIQSGSVGADGRSPLSVTEAVEIAIQVAEGLSAAHSKGIIHRDITSANIIITLSGQVKITDFGLAKYKGSSLVTTEGTVVGTPAYMSPEQARCEEVDDRSDIFSLGVLLYEMLTGHLPFTGDNDLAVLYSVVHQKPESIRKVAPHVPVGLEQITSRALVKEKGKRYQSADEILSDLRIVSSELAAPGESRPQTLAERDSRERRNRRISISVGIVILLAAGFLLLKSFLFEPALLPEPTPIAVISFENQTGDKEYDYLRTAIPNLLITSLEQSGDLRVTTWERMYDLLKQMGREDVEIIDTELGFELCRMDGIDVIVIGMFTKAGDTFVMNVKMLDVNDRDLLRSASSKGRGVGSILESQIDELSSVITLAMGVPDSIVVERHLPISSVTTTSLDAYNYFLRGRRDFEKFYYADARRFLERAVELDSTFAVAYLYLARTCGSLGDIKARDDGYEKAKVYSARATDKERCYIEADYAAAVEGNREKRIRILEDMAKKYPKEKRVHLGLARDYNSRELFDEAIDEFTKVLELDPSCGRGLNGIAYTYANMGDFDKAIEYLERYAHVSPGDANPFDSMAEIYLRMGRLDEAIAKYREALEVKPDFHSEWQIAYIYALQEDYAEAMRWADQFIAVAPSSGVRAHAYVWKAFYHYWLGAAEQSLVSLRRAADVAEAVGNEFGRAYVNWMRGWIHSDRGERELSRSHFRGWLDVVTEHPPSHMPAPSGPFYTAEYDLYIGLGCVREGQIDCAKSHLTEMTHIFSEVVSYYRDWITFRHDILYGEILLAEGFADRAIAVCEEASPLEIPYMHSEKVLLYNVPFLKDVVARAYQQQGDLDKAIAEYGRLITFNPESKERHLIHPVYHYRLARLYEENGEQARAIREYEKFLEIWRDADTKRSELVDAKARLAGLRGERETMREGRRNRLFTLDQRRQD